VIRARSAVSRVSKHVNAVPERENGDVGLVDLDFMREPGGEVVRPSGASDRTFGGAPEVTTTYRLDYSCLTCFV
jgi:hypothetical protein